MRSKVKNCLFADKSIQQTGTAHLTSESIQHILSLDEFQLLMKKAARLGSIQFVSYMRKEGMI